MTSKSLYIVSPWPGSIRESMDSLSISKSAVQFSSMCKKLDFRKIVVCSAIQFQEEIKNDITIGPRIAYLFRPVDFSIYSGILEKITHIQMLVHEQDIIEGHFERCIPLVKDKVIIPLYPEQVSFFTNYGLKTEDFLPVPIEPVPSDLNMKNILDNLSSIVKPSVCIMSNHSIRKNMYEGFLSCLDASCLYNNSVDLKVISHTGGSSSLKKSLNYYSNHFCNISFIDGPSTKDLYSAVFTSTTLVLPAFDEGYNLVLREMGRSGIDIICSNIPVNRSYTREGKVTLVPTLKKEVPGNVRDEISQITEFEIPNYKNLVHSINESMQKWKDTRNSMLSKLKSHATINVAIPGITERLSRVFKTASRKSNTESMVFII